MLNLHQNWYLITLDLIILDTFSCVIIFNRQNENPIIKDLILENFLHIIANVNSKPDILQFKEPIKKGFTSQMQDKVERNKGNIGESKAKKFSIKEKTKGKTKEHIVEMIKAELHLVDNDAKIWSNMIKAISRLNISNDVQVKRN